jgi:uncharacterized protein YraI
MICALTLMLSACGVQVNPIETATPGLLVITATLPPTLTPRPSETPPPPPPSPTVAPVEGVTSTQVNVRAEPSTVGAVLGVIPANTTVQIVGVDPGENWWQILYPQSDAGTGWVTAQFVTTAGGLQVPVIGGGGSNPNGGATAVIQQQLNIRSGPGVSFNSLGTLNPQDVVTLTGKDPNGAWLQIEFAAGPDGKGWVNAAFVRATGVESLPIIGETGQVLGTGTPENTPLPPSPTVVPAPIDNDSAQAPAVDVVFSATGTRALQYSSDVSSPTGDAEDWIQFKTYTDTVYIAMTCHGNGQLNAEFLLGNQLEASWGNAPCGGSKVIAIRPNIAYLLHIQIAESPSLTYIQYTLRIISIP